MRKLHMLVITGLLVPFLPINTYAADEEEASLSSLEEELSLLDEEFEEFKEELFSLENDMQKNAPAVESEQAIALDPPAEQEMIVINEAAEEPVAVSEETPAVEAPQSGERFSSHLERSGNGHGR
jgi:hypothetical protein